MSDVLIDTGDFHYGALTNVESLSIDTNRHGSGDSINSNLHIRNNLGVPITVSDRSGIPMRLSHTGDRTNDITIVKRIDVTTGVEIDPDQLFHNHGNKSTEGQAYTKSIEILEGDMSRIGKRTIQVIYKINRDELVYNNCGTAYIGELDLLISCEMNPSYHAHPYSRASDRLQLLESDFNINKRGGFGYSIKIISNDGSIDDKYINIAGEVYKVNVEKSKTLQNGVYLCSTAPVKSAISGVVDQTKHLSIDRAKEELNLYDSYEQALHRGDEVAAKDLEIKELQHARKIREHELEMEKLEIKRELEKAKRDMQIIEDARNSEKGYIEHERSLRTLKEKEEYERRSYKRKDINELLKYGPIILATASTIALAVIKYNDSKEK